MNDEAKKAMDRVRKLLEFNQKNNASEAEIETAAGLIRKILEEHNFSLQDVHESRIEDGIKTEESNPMVSHNHNVYMGRLASCLASAFECRLVYSHFVDKSKAVYKWRKSYIFIGYETDVLSCVYFFDYLRERLLAMANEEIHRRPELEHSRYIFTNSFIIGAANEIYKRLKRPEQERTDKSNALVKVKGRAVLKKMDEFFPNLRSHTSRGHSLGASGLEAGKRVGISISLNRGVGSVRGAYGLIGSGR